MRYIIRVHFACLCGCSTLKAAIYRLDVIRLLLDIRIIIRLWKLLQVILFTAFHLWSRSPCITPYCLYFAPYVSHLWFTVHRMLSADPGPLPFM